MRIGFEGKVLTAQAGGTGRYAINLLRALLAAPAATASDIEFVIFTGPQTTPEILHGFSGCYRERFLAAKSSLIRALALIPAALRRERIDVFHGLDHVAIPLVGKRGQYVASIHDVILHGIRDVQRVELFQGIQAIPPYPSKADPILILRGLRGVYIRDKKIFFAADARFGVDNRTGQPYLDCDFMNIDQQRAQILLAKDIGNFNGLAKTMPATGAWDGRRFKFDAIEPGRYVALIRVQEPTTGTWRDFFGAQFRIDASTAL